MARVFRRRAAFVVIATSLSLVGSAALVEGVARWRGLSPYRLIRVEHGIHVRPDGPLYQADARLGYRTRGGVFDVTLPSGLSFRLSHRSNGLRVTRPLREYRDHEPRPALWVFGCSYTYGWSVDDEATFPWRLQTSFPKLDVVNFGTNGYGTVQMLLQLEEALAAADVPPRVIVLTYAAFHHERNTLPRWRRKSLARRNHMGPHARPFARWDDGRLRISNPSDEYEPFIGSRWSAAIHFIEETYNDHERRTIDHRSVSKALLLRCAEAARTRRVDFFVAGIDSDAATRSMLVELEAEGVRVVDISMDLDQPGFRNTPHDSHPSPRAHEAYAEKLSAFLAREILR